MDTPKQTQLKATAQCIAELSDILRVSPFGPSNSSCFHVVFCMQGATGSLYLVWQGQAGFQPVSQSWSTSASPFGLVLSLTEGMEFQ